MDLYGKYKARGSISSIHIYYNQEILLTSFMTRLIPLRGTFCTDSIHLETGARGGRIKHRERERARRKDLGNTLGEGVK